MPASSLILIGSSSAVWRWAPVDAVARCWSDRDAPLFIKTTVDRVLADSTILDSASVAWVFLEDTKTTLAYELIGVLQERQLPTMLTQRHESQSVGTQFHQGIVSGSADAAPESLSGVLRTLWSQATVIQGLKSEIRLLRIHQGGLCGQIDKIDEEMRLAAQLQREFLPSSLPSTAEVEFRVLYRPAGYVSGDIYDVARLDDQHMGFFLADAVGHGVPAALFTMYIKHALHNKQVRGDDSQIVPPDEVLAQLNRDMIDQPAAKMRFASACYGVINCSTLELTLARAGHPFPIILHADGSSGFLEPEGTLLGIFADKGFEMVRVQMKPGDRILLYSDGFELAFQDTSDQSSASRASALELPHTHELQDLANGPLDDAMKRLAQKLDQQSGSLNQRDDLTLICLGVNAPSQQAKTLYPESGRQSA